MGKIEISWTVKFIIKLVLLMVAFAFFIAGMVLMATYVITLPVNYDDALAPGRQMSYNRTDDIYCLFKARSTNGSSSLVTYLFNKKPKQIPVEQKYTFALSNQVFSNSFYVPAVEHAKYRWVINANEEVDILYYVKVPNKKGSYAMWSADDVKQTNGEFVGLDTRPEGHFYIEGSKTLSGSFIVTVTWPDYDVTSTTPTGKCTSYPCELPLEESTNYWMVAVNEDPKNAVDISFILEPDQSVWLPVSLVLMLGVPIVLIVAVIIIQVVFKAVD